jgi:endonuclease/exonuclease/phosphatase family metal-dependent hydrolase
VFLHGSWRVASASVHGRPAASDHLAVAASVAPQDGS